MARITGSLLFVTDNPAQVSEVWVRAPRVRTHAGGVVTTGNDRFPVDGGEVSFTAVPGPAVLALISQGRAVDTIPILVGDGAEQTLRQVVEAADLADEWTLTELDRLAQQIAKDISDAGTLAENLGGIDGIAQTRTALEKAAQTTTDNAQAAERAKTDTINARDKAEAASTTATEQAGVATEQATEAQNNATKAAQSEAGAEEAKTEAERHATTASTSATNAANSLAQVTPTAQAAISDYIASGTSVQDAARTAVSDIAPDIVETLTRGELPWRGTLPDGTDMNTVRTKGFYTVPTTSAAVTMVNWPTRRAGVLKVFTNDSSSMTSQEVTAYVSTAQPVETYSRGTLSSTNTQWSPWSTSEWVKGLANGSATSRTDIDTFRIAGAWGISSTTYVDGLPTTASGVLEVLSWPGTGLAVQRYTAQVDTTTLEVYQRSTLSTGGFAGVAWRTMGGGQTWVQGVLPDGSDLATLRTAGAWVITGIVSARTMKDMPTDSAGTRVEGPGLVEVVATSGTARAFQRVTVDQGGKLREFTRTTALTSGWDAWQESSGGGGGAAPADPAHVPAQADVQVSDHATRVEYARSRRGGGIGTGGKAVIMLRFDHWLVAFRDRTLPILEKYQLPATLNLNVDNTTDPANPQNGAGTITWEQIQDWNQYKGIEIANHGSTHNNQTTTEGIYHEIVNGRRNLEKNMPLVAVEAWQEHGASYFVNSDIPGDIGLDLGRNISNFVESYAGRLVMQEHAVIEGKSGGFFHPLTGTPQIGQSHYSFDRSTAAEMIQQAEYAATFGAGLTMYAHPGSMDNAEVEGKYWPYEFAADGSVTLTNPATGEAWNFADEQGLRDHIAALDASGTRAHLKASHRDFDTFCAHLARMRDEGRVMIMTATGGGFADQHSDNRRNLLVAPTFGAGHESWWSYRTGWTITGGGTDGVTLTSSPTASPLGQGMLMYSRFGWAMGAAHELLVRVSADVDTTLTLQIHKLGDPTLWNAERQFTVPGDGVARDYRLNLTLPRQHMNNTLSQMTVRIGGPSMTVHGAPLLAAI